MAVRISRDDVDFFRRNLWKDERRLVSQLSEGKGEFSKDCFSIQSARRELLALELLSTLEGEQLAPRPLRLDDHFIVMERVDGIRLFDLLRYLRRLELERRDGIAEQARVTLIRRCRLRLARIQRLLMEHRHDLAACSYPLGDKITDLIRLFVRILDIRRTPIGWEEDAENLTGYWTSEGAVIPFRDATAKNIIVAERELAVRLELDPETRYAIINRILSADQSDYWDNVPIRDIDFASVEHLTTPEDDPISLHCHEWTYGSCPIAAESFILLPDSFVPDPYRTAATMVVRMLRFGGRKLGYRLVNSQGFEVRFQYDDPLFYFSTVGDACRALDKKFCAEHQRLLDLIELIGFTARNLSASDESQLRVDYFRRVYGSYGDYWQETPIERSSNA